MQWSLGNGNRINWHGKAPSKFVLSSKCQRYWREDLQWSSTKLPPSQTYEISKFSCIISRITTLALHFLILRNVISFTFVKISEFPTWFTILLSSIKKTWFVLFCHFPPNHIFCPQSWQQVGPKLRYFAFSRKSFSHKVGELRFN